VPGEFHGKGSQAGLKVLGGQGGEGEKDPSRLTLLRRGEEVAREYLPVFISEGRRPMEGGGGVQSRDVRSGGTASHETPGKAEGP